MLKIKDNVDLKELEKYGFKYDKFYCCYSKTIYYGRRGQCFDLLIGNVGHLLGYAKGADDDGEEDYIDDTLYDLIQAGLVEKVGDDDV